MTFKRDSAGRESAEAVLSVLKDEGPMTIRDITKAVSGCEVGDSHYSLYSSTISIILSHLLKKGHVRNERREGQSKTVYTYQSDLPARGSSANWMSEGTHIVRDYTVHINDCGLIDCISKDGAPVRLFIPPEVTGRGMRTIVELPISVDRFRRGLRNNKLVTETIG